MKYDKRQFVDAPPFYQGEGADEKEPRVFNIVMFDRFVLSGVSCWMHFFSKL
jgi:hypothetical protein